jgi:hypothetical protein
MDGLLLAGLLGGHQRDDMSKEEKKIQQGVRTLFDGLYGPEETFKSATIRAQVEYLSRVIVHTMTNDCKIIQMDNMMRPEVRDVLVANGFVIYTRGTKSKIFLPTVDAAAFVADHPDKFGGYVLATASVVPVQTTTTTASSTTGQQTDDAVH